MLCRARNCIAVPTEAAAAAHEHRRCHPTKAPSGLRHVAPPGVQRSSSHHGGGVCAVLAAPSNKAVAGSCFAPSSPRRCPCHPAQRHLRGRPISSRCSTTSMAGACCYRLVSVRAPPVPHAPAPPHLLFMCALRTTGCRLPQRLWVTSRHHRNERRPRAGLLYYRLASPPSHPRSRPRSSSTDSRSMLLHVVLLLLSLSPSYVY